MGAAVDAELPTPGAVAQLRPVLLADDLWAATRWVRLAWAGPTSWQTSLSEQSDDTVIVTGPGGSQRVFQPDSRNANHYFDQAGDYGVLTPTGGGTFTLTEQDGQITTFNSDGTLNYVQDTNGNKITASYTKGMLTSLKASTGQSLGIFAYNAAGLISSVTDSDGQCDNLRL